MQLLIVDDEPIIRMGLLKMAEAYAPAFKSIRTADNGQEALERIREAEPDFVLTDIRMPKLDGLGLCQAMHEHYPRIQTVVISGYNDFEYAQKCIGYGVKHYLLKPVTKSDVHEVLDKLIRKSAKSYVSVARYVDTIDRLESCIWSMQREELFGVLREWRESCLSTELTISQLKELLEDCIALLVKRFQARNFSPDYHRDALPGGGMNELLDSFEARLRQMEQSLMLVRSGNYRDPMEEAKAYIDSRLSQEISLDQVAAMIGLTPTYFSALFKKMTSETFVQYRINKRMEKAKELLSVPHIRIIDVASEVGYDDYPHFTKTFKKIVGVSPSDYRTALGIK
ncbi:response regulator transcription factor [Paenibacillus cremeus]|uniref:Response regulator n=1 Tax=Paenibacillus cremeus TaxID=2163881 RepID=A0A559K4B7_9BACL|nr:response regulator [Paenibacillus cremeus]TVY06933.1 response regulator [Paenibacillus cremeus]